MLVKTSQSALSRSKTGAGLTWTPSVGSAMGVASECRFAEIRGGVG